MKYCINYNLLLMIFTLPSLSLFSILILFNVTLVSASTDTNDSDIMESYWTTGSSMSENTNEPAAVVLDGMIYVMGGEDYVSGEGKLDSVKLYDIAKDEWIESDIPPMPLALDHTASLFMKERSMWLVDLLRIKLLLIHYLFM